LIHHGVEGVFQLENFALHVHGDLARQIASRHSRSHLSDVAHLAGQVAGHEVHVVGEIFPRAGSRHLRLASQLAFSADFTSHARHFRGKSVQLVHHRVDGVFQFENLTLHVHGDLARQIASRHRRRYFRDVAYLPSQVSRHRVDRVSQVLPRASHAGHVGLSS